MNIDFDTDFDIDFNVEDFSNEVGNENINTRYIKPKLPKQAVNKVKYSNAIDLARSVRLSEERTYAIVDGKFIFGDFIEALIIEKGLYVNEMIISTLSLSQNNIDSLAALLHQDKVIGKLDVITSNYFFSHERNILIKYMYEKLDKDNKFQLSIARTHTKVCQFITNGNYITIHGSANLRSSNNYEQLMIENSKDLYDFNKSFHDEIIKNYFTIKKELNGKK